jgi:hypothetical protein
MDRYHQADGSARKLVFVYPLCPGVEQRLRESPPPRFSAPETETDWGDWNGRPLTAILPGW